MNINSAGTTYNDVPTSVNNTIGLVKKETLLPSAMTVEEKRLHQWIDSVTDMNQFIKNQHCIYGTLINYDYECHPYVLHNFNNLLYDISCILIASI